MFEAALRDRRVVMVTIEDGDTDRKTSYKFLRTPARPFQTIAVEVAEDQDPTTAILEAIGKHTLTDAIVRVIYDLSGDRTDTVDLKTVKKALESAFMVASIAPKPKTQVNQRRASISEDMGIAEALHAYVQNHPELEDLEENLQSYGASLEAELRGGE